MFKKIWLQYQTPLLLAGLIFVCIWPISFHIFLPKWDNIDCYLPYKYFWSDAVWNGDWPWWNPYEYLGLPTYSDLQNGIFSPITWVIVLLFGKYTTTSLAIEITFYYLLGGLGMYKFLGVFESNKSLRFLLAFSYALSGFMLGTAQIMIFIMGAAWLPWIFYHMLALHKAFNAKNALLLGLLVSLNISSASPAYSIVLAYLMTGYILYQWLFSSTRFIDIVKYYGLVALIILVTCLPLIAGVIDFAPYFSRLQKLAYTPWVYEGSFDFAEYISFIFPYLTIHDSEFFGTTDVSLRNGYMGLLTLILICLGFWNWKNHFQLKLKLILLAFLFLILAAGDYTPFYKWFYELPGFGNFRHPSFFRAHALFFLITFGAIGFKGLRIYPEVTQKLSYVLLGIGITAMLWGFWNTSLSEIAHLFNSIIRFVELPKFTVFAFWFVAGLMIVLISSTLIITRRKFNWTSALMISGILDIVIHAHLIFPNTVVLPPKFNQAEVTSAFQNLPDTINQIPVNTPLNQIPFPSEAFSNTPIWRNQSTFVKTITPAGHNATQFLSFNNLEENGGLEKLLANPLLYAIRKQYDNLEEVEATQSLWNSSIEYSCKTKISQAKLEQNKISFHAENNSDSTGLVVFVQNFHHNWFVEYKHQITKPIVVNDGVIGIEIPPGYDDKVDVVFKAPWIKSATIFSVFGWLMLPFIFWALAKKN